MTRADWGTELINSLGARRPIITFDSRGVGESDCPEGPYTIEMLANDCADILRYELRGQSEMWAGSEVNDQRANSHLLSLLERAMLWHSQWTAYTISRDAGTKNAAILGVSMGGMIAQLLAKNNPSLVHALVCAHSLLARKAKARP
jgi:pimeloyl-ACP methyl ester carboxylesterase